MAAPGSDDNGNGRVTLAVISTKLDNLADKLDEQDKRNEKRADDFETRLRSVEAKTTWWNSLNTVAVAIAAWLGLSK